MGRLLMSVRVHVTVTIEPTKVINIVRINRCHRVGHKCIQRVNHRSIQRIDYRRVQSLSYLLHCFISCLNQSIIKVCYFCLLTYYLTYHDDLLLTYAVVDKTTFCQHWKIFCQTVDSRRETISIGYFRQMLLAIDSYYIKI